MKYEVRESSRHMLNGIGNWLVFNVTQNHVALNNIPCKSAALLACAQMNGVRDHEFIKSDCPCKRCNRLEVI
jgi:hypothetical protein